MYSESITVGQDTDTYIEVHRREVRFFIYIYIKTLFCLEAELHSDIF